MSIELGIIKKIIGMVSVQGPDGEIRVLNVGDQVFLGDQILTSDGSVVEIEFPDGSVTSIDESGPLSLEDAVPEPYDFEDAEADQEAILQAIAEGADPTESLEAPAAGESAATIQNNALSTDGIDFSFINYKNQQTIPEAGFDTIGVENGFNEELIDLGVPVNQEPAISQSFIANQEPTTEQVAVTELGTGDITAPPAANNTDTPTAGTTVLLLDEGDLSAGFVANGYSAIDAAFEAATGLSASPASKSGNNDVSTGDDEATDGATVLSGALSVDFGEDGTGDITFNGANDQPSGFTSGGAEVQYWVSEDGHNLVGFTLVDDGLAEVVFTAEITNPQTGEFTAVLYGSVDHPNSSTSTEDNLAIDLGFVATDSDGDPVQGVLRFDIEDDSPLIKSSSYEVKTESFENLRSAPGWGVEGEGGFTFTGDNGVVWTTNSAGIEAQFGAYGGISAADGNVKVELDTHDVLDDGGTTNAQLSTEVVLPGTQAQISFDYNSRTGYKSSSMQVSMGDSVIEVNGATSQAKVLSGNATITSELNDNGWTSFTVNFMDLTEGANTLMFEGVGREDNRGAYLDNITIDPNVNLQADEANLSVDTSADFSGYFTTSFGADAEGSTDYELVIANSDTGLFDTQTGEAIILQMNNGVLEGLTETSNAIAFTVVVDGNGVVTLNQARAIQHSDDVTSISTGKIELLAKANDGDGDVAEATLDLGSRLSFIDDVPTSTPDTNGDDGIKEDVDLSAIGNVLLNDSVGADGAKVTTTGDFEGTYGQISLSENGDYTYQLDNNSSLVQQLAEGQVVTDVFNYTVTDGDGDESVNTVTMTITGSNDSPQVIALSANTNENTAVTFTLQDLLDGATDIDSTDTLRVENVRLASGDGQLVDNGDNSWTYTPSINSDSDAVVNFDVTDGQDSVANTLSISVSAIADDPNLIVSVGEPLLGQVKQSIDISNVNSTDNGFTVKAFDINGNATSISTLNGNRVVGFGVDGRASGAGKELGSNKNGSEMLQIDLANKVSSVDVSFSWLRGGGNHETAAYTFYLDGLAVGSGTTDGLTDTIDGPFKLLPDSGSDFDRIEFTAPLTVNDDYLINSLSFGKIESYDYPVKVESSLTDVDGSESLGSVSISNLPEGVSYNGSALISDSPLTASQINQIKASVTSTEIDGNDQATTTVNAKVESDSFNASSETADLYIEGDAESNSIIGGEGDDIIFGGGGNDILEGGDGADEFIFKKEDMGTAQQPAKDQITDFSPDEGDVINLSDILSDPANNNTIEGIEENGQLSILIKNDGDVTQQIDVFSIAVTDNASAADQLNALLQNGSINDGI